MEKGSPFFDVYFANKDNLLPQLQTILKESDFCVQEPIEFTLLINLLAQLKDNIWFAIENLYVDRHYRDTYYSFHSSKFKEVGRNCIRVHIFEEEITESDLLNKEKNFDDIYCGFFIIRPLIHFILGRSVISPKAYINNNFVCCLMKDRVSLLGNVFTVHGFPHIAQDTETHTCAESALWCFITYFGSKYHNQYKPLLPSQIIKSLLTNPEHRILPSVGLTDEELLKCLNSNDFQCLKYSMAKYSTANPVSWTFNIYIESGIPLLLYLVNKEDAHAVLAIGHEMNDSVFNAKEHPYFKESAWIDASSIKKELVLIDDNMPPYQIADISMATAHYPEPKIRDMIIQSFIVSLPAHMFLVAEKAFNLMSEIFNDEKIGLQTLGGKWVTRLLLTGGRSFKNFLLEEDENIPVKLKKWLLYLSLPKFIWLCQVYKIEDYNKKGPASGLLIIDSTSNGKAPSSILWYSIENNLYMNDDNSWSVGQKIPTFKMTTYKNNLKGEWNQWKS
jgi:hypothetical protein